MGETVNILGYQVQPFPIRYLGLPLSTRSIPKANCQAPVEQVARKMPSCHGSLMVRSERLVWSADLRHDSREPPILGTEGD